MEVNLKYFVLVLLSIFQCSNHVFAAVTRISLDDQNSNWVSIIFTDKPNFPTLEEWNAGNKDELLFNKVIGYVNSYCLSNTMECYKQNTACQLEETGFMLQGYPKPTAPGINAKFVIPIKSCGEQVVIPRAVLKKLVTENKASISSAVGYQVKFVYPPDNYFMNTVMLPVSFGILFLVIVIVLILHVYHRRKAKSDKQSRSGRSTEPDLPLVATKGSPPRDDRGLIKQQKESIKRDRLRKERNGNAHGNQDKRTSPKDAGYNGEADDGAPGEEERRRHRKKKHRKDKKDGPAPSRLDRLEPTNQEPPPPSYNNYYRNADDSPPPPRPSLPSNYHKPENV